MLSTSDYISSSSEPWILLPFLYTLKADGTISEYWHSLMITAVRDFYNGFPNKRNDYVNELRNFILKLYTRRSNIGAKYFLDKTPRYHLICNEIIELFPDAKFIFLWRNPLAIVSSIINSWTNKHWKLSYHKIDLYQGVSNLIMTYENWQSNVHSLRYENLIRFPYQEIKKICDYLNLDFENKMVSLFKNIDFKGSMGDHLGTKKYKYLNHDSIDSWKNTFNNSYRRYWARKYLNWIGDYNLSIMGYNKKKILENLSTSKDLRILGIIEDLLRCFFYCTRSILEHYRKTRKNKIWYTYN